jgi:ATP-binding cassette, subfamily C, bacterial
LRAILDIFLKTEGTNPWTVVLCMLAAGLAEGIGLATLLPLLTLATDSGSETSPVHLITERMLGALGISPTLGVLLLIVVGALVLRSLLTMLAMRHVGYTVAEVATRLRAQLVERVLRARWGYLVHQPAGRVTNALSGETTRAAEAYQQSATFVALAIETAILLVVAFVVSWKLTFAAVTIGAVVAAALHVLVRIARKAGWRQTDRMIELVTFLSDTMNNIKPLKAMARQAAFQNLFERKIGSLRRAIRRQVISKEALKGAQEILLAIALGVACFVAVAVYQADLLQLLVVGVIISRTIKSLGKLQGQYQVTAMLEGAFVQVRRLVDEAGEAREPSHGRRAARFERECRLDGVTFAYGPTLVLDDVRLSIPAGSVTVLTGSSGAGKTTIMDLILGLYAPQAGRVLIDGVPLSEIDLQSWRLLIGYVPQELVLFHDTILGNIALGDPEIGEGDVREALGIAGALEFVDALPDGMRTVVGEKGAKLSGGQRQRIALARALVGRPKLLVLDEVTSALDPETERQVSSNIAALAGRTTVLAITHRPTFLDIADRVYCVADRTVFAVDPAELGAVRRADLVAGL